MGEWANGQDPKILDKNIDKIFENIKLLQQERNNSEYHEFFVGRTIKEWLIEEMNRCENTNKESNNRISDTDNEDTNEMASSTDLKLQYSCPEISADFKDVLDDEHINVCLPIKVDMTKIRANNSTNMNKHIKAVNGLAKKIIDADIQKTEGNKYNFIYVTQRHDGMVTVVGESHFKVDDKGTPLTTSGNCGDLYKELNSKNVSGEVGTEQIIFGSIFDIDIFLEYENLLKNYYKTVWMIPIPNGLNAEKYEKSLGGYLLKNHVPILTTFSH